MGSGLTSHVEFHPQIAIEIHDNMLIDWLEKVIDEECKAKEAQKTMMKELLFCIGALLLSFYLE